MAVGYHQVDKKNAWTIKYALRVSLKISSLQSTYVVVISAKYSFITLFLTSTKLEYERYLNRLRKLIDLVVTMK